MCFSVVGRPFKGHADWRALAIPFMIRIFPYRKKFRFVMGRVSIVLPCDGRFLTK